MRRKFLFADICTNFLSVVQLNCIQDKGSVFRRRIRLTVERNVNLYLFLQKKTFVSRYWFLLVTSIIIICKIMADQEFEEFRDGLDDLPQHFTTPVQTYK